MADTSAPGAGHSDRPNILVLMTDQQRYDSLGCYGFAPAHTPNLDRLAADGVLFERCYVNNPLCNPSRASMMTGKHVQGHGVYQLYDNLPQDEVLFPERLQQAGYETALFGKLHVSSLTFEDRQRNAHDGFDIYEWCLEHCLNLDSPFNGYVAWLKEHDPALLARLRAEGRERRARPVRVTHDPLGSRAHDRLHHPAAAARQAVLLHDERVRPAQSL